MNTQAENCNCNPCVGPACDCGCQERAARQPEVCECGCQQGKACECGA
jgi:hypothetical protein